MQLRTHVEQFGRHKDEQSNRTHTRMPRATWVRVHMARHKVSCLSGPTAHELPFDG